MEIDQGRVDVNGLTFHYLEAGRGPLVLCLHGFPDNAYTYSELLPALAEAGFRGVAPFMRGYAPTTPSPDGRYQSAAVRGDLVASYERHKGIWHAYFFQMPFAEQIVAANDFAFLEQWWRDASPEFDPAAVIERVKSTLRQPRVVTAALNYYRHTFHPANRDPALQDLQQRASSAPTPVPTLALHGTRDRPGRLEAFEGMDDLFLKGLEVNRRIVEFLRAG